MSLPDKITYDPLDDIFTVDIDLESLYNKFIVPIEKMRSFAAPTVSERPVGRDGSSVINLVADTANIDPSEPQESRAHAFYRMIGFPVISSNLDFYNPGFNPTISSDERTKNINISARISSQVRYMHQQREISARNRLAYFKKSNIDACVFALVMGFPGGIKPFLQMNPSDNFDSINQIDRQEYSIAARKLFLDSKYQRTDGNNFTNYFTSGNHILRPFNVDPNISDTVTGFTNETRNVAAPFLQSKKDTGIERNIFAKRPGLEFILRLRLRQQSESAALQETIFAINSTNSIGLNISDLRLTAGALLNEFNITDEDIKSRLKNSRNLELININKLIKTIKGIISLLITSIDTIDYVSKTTKWTPLPSERGPEGGSEVSGLLKTKRIFELDRRIIDLTIRSENAKRQGEISDNPEILSNYFHLSEFENTEKVFLNQLNDAIEERNSLHLNASNALRAIEIITGEVSGLGLIDILAIYTALWAIDIDVLISMLDNNSFNRLYQFNPDLRTSEVEARRAAGAPVMSIDKAMQAFESQVINILSFSDKIFMQKLGSPINADGGTISSLRL